MTLSTHNGEESRLCQHGCSLVYHVKNSASKIKIILPFVTRGCPFFKITPRLTFTAPSVKSGTCSRCWSALASPAVRCVLGPGAGRACEFPPCLCCLGCTLQPNCISFDCGVIKGRNMPHRILLFWPATKGQINLWPLVRVEMRGRKGPNLFVLASPEPTELICAQHSGRCGSHLGHGLK